MPEPFPTRHSVGKFAAIGVSSSEPIDSSGFVQHRACRLSCRHQARDWRARGVTVNRTSCYTVPPDKCDCSKVRRYCFAIRSAPGDRRYQYDAPPVTSKCCPLTKDDNGPAKYSAASATSVTVAIRPRECRSAGSDVDDPAIIGYVLSGVLQSEVDALHICRARSP